VDQDTVARQRFRSASRRHLADITRWREASELYYRIVDDQIRSSIAKPQNLFYLFRSAKKTAFPMEGAKKYGRIGTQPIICSHR